MTITCQPMDATSGAPAYSAQNERQNMAALYGGGGGVVLGARSGWRPGTPMNILTATSTTWTLTPCSAVITPGAATAQGSYRWSADANVTGSVTAADATYARKDIAYITVNDSSSGDGSGALTAPVLYLAGTPAASPVAPTLPARSYLVGTINVPLSGGGSPTVVMNTAVFVGAGAIQPVFSLTERDGLTKYDSLTVRRMDLTGFPLETCRATVWGPEAGAQGIQPGVVKVTANGAGLTSLAVQNNIASYAFRGGRKYKIVWHGGYSLSVATDYFNLAIQTSSTADAAGAITGLTQVQGRSYTANAAGAGESFYVEAIYEPATDTTLQVKFTVARSLGSGTWTLQAAAGAPSYGYIEDQGAQY